MFIAAMREGLRTGMVASAAMTRDVEAQTEGYISSDLPALIEPLKNMVDESGMFVLYYGLSRFFDKAHSVFFS
jgi:hypothetical protein